MRLAIGHVMIIGIDIRVLGPKFKSGIEEYVGNLLAHMLSLDSGIKFKLFYSSFGDLPAGGSADYDFFHLPNVEVKKFRFPNRLIFYSSRLFNFPKIDKLLGGVDVFFSPHFFISALSRNVKRVTTFHDLSFEHFPEFFTRQQRFWHRFGMNPSWQAKFSDRIIAVSESTKNDLVKRYSIDPAKIEVIYSGISPMIKRPSQDKLELFRRREKLPENFILFLGKLEPRKNVIGLIKALNVLKLSGDPPTGGDDMHLVIAGSRGWLCKDIFKEAEKSPYRSQIIFKDYISDEARPYYYSLASVFVYPSFFEGFGFPPLEAMTCGTPVVASNNSSLPEVVGEAGLLVDPYNVSDMAEAIRNLLEDKRLRDSLIKKGLARSQQFSWQKCAEKTLEILVKI